MSKVFVNGVFDLLHPGHIELLKFAKSQGDMLLVAIDSDLRVTENKRLPIYDERTRKHLLEAIRYVNRVKIFSSDKELVDLIDTYRPQVMVVGEEYKDKKVIGAEYAEKLLFFPRIGPYGTTKTIKDIASRGNVH